LPFDKFGNNYFYPSKQGGFNYEMSDNPKNDSPLEGLDSDFSVSGNIITMKCNGATSFSVGKNGRGFSDSIGGCNMDFKATAKRGYGYKADDVRDLEFKVWMRIPSNLSSGHDGFSMSACTGHHSASGCCQGFAYMGSIEGANSNPTHFRFRKETLHVEYTDSSEGIWTHPLVNFKLSGHDWFGFGFCRYNKPTSGGTSPQDDSVILEIWFNPDPTNDPTKWTMLKRTEDKKGRGWTGSKGKCNGDNDQIGVWSNAHNRLKSNSTSGTIQFTNISFREIDAFGTFEEPPPGGSGGGGSAVQRSIYYAMVSGTPSTYLHLSSVTGHEIVETLTDPDPLDTFGGLAWGNSAGKEISDPCENIFTAYADGLDVEAYWSNSDDKCVVPGLTIPDTVQVPTMTNRGGGEVIAHGKVYLIYWGLDWSTRVATPTATVLTDKIQNKMLGTDSTYFSKLSQYGCSIPTWGGAVFNTTFPIPSGNIPEQKGRDCIVDTFNKGLLPIPTVTNDDVYVLYVPVGKDITPLGETSTPGGFHDTWNPFLTPFVVPCPTGFHRNTSGACIPDTVTCPAGQHEENGVCVENDVPVGDPSPPSKVKGIFVLKRDINIYRDDACEGTGGSGGGGGGGGRGIFYDALPDNDKPLSDTSLWFFRTRLAAQINKIASGAFNKVLKQLSVPLKKVGSPAASPTVTAVIWDKNNNVVYTSPTAIDPTTLPTSFDADPVNWVQFDFSANTHIFVLGDRVGVRYFADSATSDVNYVVGGYETVTNPLNNTMIQYESSIWKEFTLRDWAAVMYD
jgi:hypothetical protein